MPVSELFSRTGAVCATQIGRRAFPVCGIDYGVALMLQLRQLTCCSENLDLDKPKAKARLEHCIIYTVFSL